MTALEPIDTNVPMEMPAGFTMARTGRCSAEQTPNAAKAGRSAELSVNGGGASE